MSGGSEPLAGLELIGEASVLATLSTVKQGRVYALDSGWWRGMPGHPIHPNFDIITYRTPRGEQVQQDAEFLARENNAVGYGFITELVMGTTHTGTHIDALCHVTCGPRSEWHGGHAADDYLGDAGALNSDAAALKPIIARGVLLDIPRLYGLDHLPRRHAIDAGDLSAAAEGQGVEVRRGDVVLVRTGQMSFWPELDAMEVSAGSGVSLDGSTWLVERRPAAVGADNAGFELAPSNVPGHPSPVHAHLVKDNGIPILEWVNCEELAADEVYEFAFICLPLTIRGASGSMVRPIAVI
ncbi:MAG TPA: cyclase family protein [Solirubrobacteraceae bacterium]|nr:cyclase family protein [Solirubrobacteraceae bacterium]